MFEGDEAARQDAPVHSDRPIVACWGELVWDHFDGSAALNVGQVLGGSGAAIAVHLSALDAEPRLVSAVGDDSEGERAITLLEQRGVSVSGVLRRQTGSTAAVRVSIDATGEPAYSRSRRLEWASVDFESALATAAVRADALVFSLFAQGTCLDLRALEHALERARPRLVGCDLNLRRAVSAQQLARVTALADFVKLNQAEYQRAAEALSGEEPAAWLLRSGRTELVAVTSGAAGARLLTRTGAFTHPGHTPAGRVDAVGAGDAFFAALTLALLSRLPQDQALARAVAHAETQLTLPGALPKSRERNGDEPR